MVYILGTLRQLPSNLPHRIAASPSIASICPAEVDNVIDISRGTTIACNGAEVHTVEHVLAAVVGAGIDNLDIEVDGNETPLGDGSSLPFTEVLNKVGRLEQDAERKFVKIEARLLSRRRCHAQRPARRRSPHYHDHRI